MKQPRASRFAGAPASVTTLSVGPELLRGRAPAPSAEALAPEAPTTPYTPSSSVTMTPEQRRVADLYALLEFEQEAAERARRARERAEAAAPPLDEEPTGSFLDHP